ncbi:MAG: sensor domain-containing diguanylate cyclase [Gemmatimonadota bacterium]|nr:sensor domain-containing diguanylate cyclase [Gemmatimonadota bacterium]
MTGKPEPGVPPDPLDALVEGSRRLGLADRLEDIVAEVLAQACRIAGTGHAALMLIDEPGGTLRTADVRGYGDRADELRHRVLGPGEGLCGWVAEHRRPLRAGDVRAEPRYVEGLPGARSNLAVPLLAGDRVAGVLNVESERPEAFSERDERLLTVLGAQAGMALFAFRSHDDLRQRIREMEALNRIGRLASEGGALGATLNSMLEIAEEILPDVRCALLLLDHERGVLRVAAGQGYRLAARYLEIPLGRGVTGRCARTGEPQVVDDIAQRSEAGDYIEGIPDARSEAAVPLVAEGEVMGVFNAESVRPSAFGERELQTLALIARQASAVIRAAQLLQETRRLATTDPLTGLHNRRQFTRQLEENVRRASRYGEGLALVLLDLDFFKNVNDRFGHQVGDEVLQSLATTLQDAVRETDQTARIGGEEFALVLLRCDRELALQIAERVREGIGALGVEGVPHAQLQLSASIGIAFLPADASEPKALMRAADEALYSAKRMGRDLVVLASEIPPAERTIGSDVERSDG